MKRFPALLGKPVDTWQGMPDQLGRTVSWLKSKREEIFEQGVVRTKLVHRSPNQRKIAYRYSLLLEFWYLGKFEKGIIPKEKLSLLNDPSKHEKEEVKVPGVRDSMSKGNEGPENPFQLYHRRLTRGIL